LLLSFCTLIIAHLFRNVKNFFQKIFKLVSANSAPGRKSGPCGPVFHASTTEVMVLRRAPKSWK
jgi:hypothetical protein